MAEVMLFGIPVWAELAAVGLGALQGALFAGAATDRRIDVLGAVLVGAGLAPGCAAARRLPVRSCCGSGCRPAGRTRGS